MDKKTFLSSGVKFKREKVDIAEIGEVYVREVSAAEGREQAKREKEGADFLESAAWLASCVLCDEHGDRLLADSDIDQLKLFPLRVLAQIGEVAGRLSMWSKKNEHGMPPIPGTDLPSASAAN